ncbi:organic hydroperoxide resistance protein [Caulobacter sp. 17J80-11]|uniref:organic hydroperoxide resistance protein n=1 Tax=Caulobacter sp. 17J80-11 TaxID=2763502 RepID=UPI0016536672|nr:organic hydroperoxide resistance protein [Caulobacter sp. 17J80-11]MBC6980186.1 organic hydroperoxide resistance protein [Caulobacter sp. 17J80-11]
MSTQVLYRAKATAVGGRDGRAASDDGRLDVALSRPAGLGGDNGPGTNPEQLFAAGYAACFEGALRFVAHQQGKALGKAQVSAEVGIGPRAAGGFGLEVALTVDLPDLDRDAAQVLVDAAHQVCPYSNATRGNIDVKLALAA